MPKTKERSTSRISAYAKRVADRVLRKMERERFSSRDLWGTDEMGTVAPRATDVERPE